MESRFKITNKYIHIYTPTGNNGGKYHNGIPQGVEYSVVTYDKETKQVERRLTFVNDHEKEIFLSRTSPSLNEIEYIPEIALILLSEK